MLPDWTNSESGVADEGNYQTFIFGVGLDEHLALSEDDARAAASQRAREALSRYLEVRIAAYLARVSQRATAAANTTSGGETATAHVAGSADAMTRSAQEATQQTLQGVEVVFAFDRARGVVYARARVSTATIYDAAAPYVEATAQPWVQEHQDEARQILSIELASTNTSSGA